MTFIARTKLQAVSDGPFTVQPGSATIITISKSKEGLARWWLPFGLITLLAGILGGASYGNHNMIWLPSFSISLEVPDVKSLLVPDPESISAYAETINPPPNDVVVPIPIVSELPPALEKVAGNSLDLSAGIALPASSLQVPDPSAPEASPPVPVSADPAMPDPATVTTDADVRAVAVAINDAPALAAMAKPRIEVTNVDAPIIGHMIEEGRLMLQSGDYEGAMATYKRVLTHQKDNRAALAGQAFAAQRMSDFDTAVKADHHLLALDPGNETARINLLAALSAWNEPQALKELQHIVATQPDFAPAQVALAQRLAADNKALVALPHMERGLELDPDNVAYKLDLAVIYDRLGHSEEAVDLYRDVLKVSDALDAQGPALPVSRTTITQRVSYLMKLMASVENLAAQQ